MKYRMTLVSALDMAALGTRYIALSMVCNGKRFRAAEMHTPDASHSECKKISQCTPQQVHVRSAHRSDVSHLLRAS